MNIKTNWEIGISSKKGKNSEINRNYFTKNENIGLFILCDGDSDKNGQDAAKIAALKAKSIIGNSVDKITSYNKSPNIEGRKSIRDLIDSSIQESSRAVFREREKWKATTSLDLILILTDHILIAHVGNGRLGYIKNGHVFIFSKDHTVYQKILETHPSDLKIDPAYKKDLSRAVGALISVKVDYYCFSNATIDGILMMTDGCNFLFEKEDELRSTLKILNSNQNIQKITDQLIQKSEQANISDTTITIIKRTAQNDKNRDAAIETIENNLQSIKVLPLFSEIQDNEIELNKVLFLTSPVSFEKGYAAVKTGEFSNEFFILTKGNVVALKNGQVVYNLTAGGPGGLMGEIGVFLDIKRTFDAITTTEVNALVIRKTDFDQFMQREPVLGMKLYRAFARHLFQKLDKISEDEAQLIEKNRNLEKKIAELNSIIEKLEKKN